MKSFQKSDFNNLKNNNIYIIYITTFIKNIFFSIKIL